MTEPSDSWLTDLLRRAMQEIDPRRARAVLAELRERSASEQQAFLGLIEVCLSDAEAMRRRRAAQLLGWLGTGVPWLLPLRRDPSWVVREAAVVALAALTERPTEVKAWLIEVALFDRQAQVRMLAGRALAANGVGVAELSAALDHAHFSVRCRALYALGFFAAQGQAFLPRVSEQLTASHRKVRQAAAECLGRLEKAGTPALPGLVRRLFDQEERVARTAREAIGRLHAHLSASIQGWLDDLLPVDGDVGAAVDRALAHPDLPVEAATAFEESCRRRLNWYRSRLGLPLCEEPLSLAAIMAEGRAQAEALFRTSAARPQEAAWQAALLLGILQQQGD